MTAYKATVGRRQFSTSNAGTGCLAILVVLVIGAALVTLWGGVAVGAANAWIMQGTFGEAWSAYWDRWYIGLGWAILFMGGFGARKGN